MAFFLAAAARLFTGWHLGGEKNLFLGAGGTPSLNGALKKPDARSSSIKRSQEAPRNTVLSTAGASRRVPLLLGLNENAFSYGALGGISRRWDNWNSRGVTPVAVEDNWKRPCGRVWVEWRWFSRGKIKT